MITRSGVLTTLEKNQDKIKKFGVKRLAVFGSYAKNKQQKNSDVDVLVEFRPGEKSFDRFMELQEFLRRVLRRKVDLVTPQALKPSMRQAVLKEARYARL